MTAIPQIEKTQFINNTGGWLGVVVIDPKGADRGVNVEPGGTVWLSEAEQRLTANAPRRPEDNPFIKQTHTRRNPDTGELESYDVTPLTVCSDMRFVPADTRPIPATTPAPRGIMEAQAAATAEEPTVVTTGSMPAVEREMALQDAPPNLKPNEPVPTARARAAAEAAQGAPEEQAWVEGEETGTAAAPSGDAPEGEYAAGEEVGTPTEGTEAAPQQQQQPAGDEW